LDTVLGSILRIIPDERDPATCGFNTAGNPLSNVAGTANMGGDRRIFTKGNRHSYRASFDKMTGDLWFGDVGQNTREEIDFLPRTRIEAVLARREPMANFAWPCLEGEVRGPIVSATCDMPGEIVAPVFTFDSGNQASVIGGYLYRGTALPALQGMYIFGDFGNQSIRLLDPSRRAGPNNFFAERRLFATATTGGRPWSMGEDRAGELYAIFGTSGQIRKIAAAPAAAAAPGAQQGLPMMLSQAGVFSDTAGLVPARGVVPYMPASRLFSDNTEKMRFFGVPGDGKIRFSPDGRFDFPQGSVFVKQFDFAGKRIETRILARSGDIWRGFTFEWLPDQRDAVLVGEDGKIEKENLLMLSNGMPYELPSRADCQSCHNRGTSQEPLQIIGFTAQQLNTQFLFARDANSGGQGRMENQLVALNRAGFFDRDISASMASVRTLAPNPTDPQELPRLSNAEVNSRARSFLESNCAPCHRPGGNTPTPIDLQATTPNARTLIFNQPPGEGDVKGANRIIEAGNPKNSVLLQRMMITGRNQQGMGSLAHQQLDRSGIALIEEWINRAIDAQGNVKP
jgi:uncharacterized repeat protein (TIGR03806 family)